eukprot:CAMPEP_0116103354 /NCGR_PEP_ID=MMETSP0327-20121206/13837_1 /TAXON_ID=44447 /ORGANISM="Pseudo-nitzschia delicatissima, Strain B596" /LENGTH=474 /DNA_ID=CAMNT_0003595453 /DNA_START=44 /DNA_END=1465 /DNA_ORIENTATION=-
MRRLLSKGARWMAGAICFAVVFYNYGKWIVVSSNRVFDASSIKDLDDSPGKHNPVARSKIPFHDKVGNNTSLDLPSDQTSKNSIAEAEEDSLRFYILPSPDITELLKSVFNQSKSELLDMASKHYQNALNEESAEMWLHRGFQRLPARSKKKSEADVYIVAGYFHLFSVLLPSWDDALVQKLYRRIIVDPTKPHLILTPTWNPERSRKIGLHSLVKTLQLRGVSSKNLWSVGFERNVGWQPVPDVSNILPIPYVVQQDENSQESAATNTKRTENSVFFAGDPRKNADNWSGCSRPNLINALQEKLPLETTDLSLLHKENRMNQTTHKQHMRNSEYCLVLCGDTPSSRTLSAAIVEGCIPVRVGSRLRGLCNPPCHPGFGWKVTGIPHLPYEERIDWNLFPEIDEAELLSSKAKYTSLQSLFQHETLRTNELYAVMDKVRSGFVYGYGNPVVSEKFGDAASYIWESFAAELQKTK